MNGLFPVRGGERCGKNCIGLSWPEGDKAGASQKVYRCGDYMRRRIWSAVRLCKIISSSGRKDSIMEKQHKKMRPGCWNIEGLKPYKTNLL